MLHVFFFPFFIPTLPLYIFGVFWGHLHTNRVILGATLPLLKAYSSEVLGLCSHVCFQYPFSSFKFIRNEAVIMKGGVTKNNLFFAFKNRFDNCCFKLVYLCHTLCLSTFYICTMKSIIKVECTFCSISDLAFFSCWHHCSITVFFARNKCYVHCLPNTYCSVSVKFNYVQ